MFNIGLHRKLNRILNLFYRLGIWQQSETDAWTVVFKFIHLITYASFGVSLLSGAFLSDDRSEAIFLTVASMASAVLAIKLGYVMWLQKEVYTFLHDIGNHSIIHRSEFLRTEQKINNFMKFVTVFLAMTFFGLAPIIIYCLPIFSNERKLGLNIGFPLDWRNNDIAYWTAYFYIMYSYVFSIVCMLITVIIWYLMSNCSIKYELLGFQFKNLGSKRTTAVTSKQRTSSEEDKVSLIMDLIDLIKAHQKLKM